MQMTLCAFVLLRSSTGQPLYCKRIHFSNSPQKFAFKRPFNARTLLLPLSLSHIHIHIKSVYQFNIFLYLHDEVHHTNLLLLFRFGCQLTDRHRRGNGLNLYILNCNIIIREQHHHHTTYDYSRRAQQFLFPHFYQQRASSSHQIM